MGTCPRCIDLERERDEARYENREAHAMLTGKFEIGWCMTHPDGQAETELGKAAMEKNQQLHASEQSRRALEERVRAISEAMAERERCFARREHGDVVNSKCLDAIERAMR